MKVRLHFAEKLRIVDWLRANKEDLMRRQDDYEVVAERIGRELNLNVTFNGLRGILKDIDMLWFRTSQRRGPTGRITRGLGKKTIARLEADYEVEPIKPIEPTAPIVKQSDLFLDDDGTITNGTADRVQNQIDGLRNKVTTMTSRAANAPDLADLIAAVKRMATTVESIGDRVGDIENALTKPETQV